MYKTIHLATKNHKAWSLNTYKGLERLLKDVDEDCKLDLCTKDDSLLLQVSKAPPNAQKLKDGARFSFEMKGGWRRNPRLRYKFLKYGENPKNLWAWAETVLTIWVLYCHVVTLISSCHVMTSSWLCRDTHFPQKSCPWLLDSLNRPVSETVCYIYQSNRSI